VKRARRDRLENNGKNQIQNTSTLIKDKVLNKAMSFESLKCWQMSKNIAIEIYQISSTGELSKDFGLKEQLRRSAVSIPSNIAEGKERGTSCEFIRFLLIAKSSAAELMTQLIIAKDVGYLSQSDFLDLKDKVDRISSSIGALIKSIKNR